MHIKKMTRTETIKILGHDFREHSHYRNENVVPELKGNNVIFQYANWKTVKDRLQNVYVYGKNGKHADEINYACSVIVYKPKDCDTPDEVFFPRMVEQLKKKFGKNNFIGAIVHYDERDPDGNVRPHLHFIFTPVVYDKKKNRDKLCCKEVMTREMLQAFHTEMEEAYYTEYGESIHLQDEDPNKRTKANIEDIEDYKKMKDLNKALIKENKELKDENKELTEKIESQTASSLELANQNKELFFENKELKQENTILKNENERIQKEKDSLIEKMNKVIKDFGDWLAKTEIGAMILNELDNQTYQKVKDCVVDIFNR